MVWSLDTDDFHGDCADVSINTDQINFPLMHAINDAIVNVLEDIEKNRENTIPHSKHEKGVTASANKFDVNRVLAILYILFVIRYF